MGEYGSFGAWIQRRRKALDLTQAELAEQVGCALGTIRKIETDERRPSKQLAARLADHLLLAPDERAAFLRAARAEVGVDQLPTSTRLTPLTAGTPTLPGGTVTFLFTDVEASTQLWERRPQAMGAALARHEALLHEAIADAGGAVFKLVGDALYAAFASAPDALRAALAGQRALQRETWGATGPLRVRMALHTGAVEERGGDYFGLPLSRGARLLSAAHGGQILLSLATEQLVREHLPPGATLRDLGVHRLKDLSLPEQIFQLIAADLPSGFAPLQTLDAHRTNLPAQSTPLIGREREIAATTDLLRRGDVRLVTLTGPGGTGKTRLGLQVAVELLNDFADGCYFVNLAPISDPQLVAAAIAHALGAAEVAGRSVEESLHAFLRARRALLLLDNFEQVLDAAPLVAELLAAAPRLKALVTSRAVLHLYGEHELAVPPLALPPPYRATESAGSGSVARGASSQPAVASVAELTQYDAVKLFIARAQAARPNFAVTSDHAPAVAAICRRLDGLPLAIELAAARVKFFQPDALLARLERRLQVLTGGPRDLPARQQTLRNTIDWSYNLLDQAEQVLLRRLGVFVGGCTLASAAAVCNADGDLPLDLVDGLASLMDKSLLRHSEGADAEPRFTMLETVSEYALERLEESGEAQALRRQHAGYFLALAEEAERHRYAATQGEWLPRLDAEHDNMRAALAWSQTAPDGMDVGARLAGALQWFWYIRRYKREGRAWLERVLEQTASSAAPARAKALYGAGRFQSDQGRATALIEQALALWRELGDKPGMADALLNLGRVARIQGDYERSAMQLQESLALFREQQIMWGVVWALNSLADVALDQGDPDKALAPVQEALALTESLGDTYGNMWARCQRGRLAHQQGDLELAAMLLEESLEWLRAWRSPSISELLNDVGWVAFERGETERAAAYFAESLKLSAEPGSEADATLSLVGLAAVAGELGQPARAARLLGAAKAIRAATGRSMMPVERAVFDRHAAAIRAQLDEATFAASWAEGQTMSLEQAMANALVR